MDHFKHAKSKPNKIYKGIFRLTSLLVLVLVILFTNHCSNDMAMALAISSANGSLKMLISFDINLHFTDDENHFPLIDDLY